MHHLKHTYDRVVREVLLTSKYKETVSFITRQFPQSGLAYTSEIFSSSVAYAIGAAHVCLCNEDIFAYEEHEIPPNCRGNKAFNPSPLPRDRPTTPATLLTFISVECSVHILLFYLINVIKMSRACRITDIWLSYKTG